MACDPSLVAAPRCRLRALFTRPGVPVTGYGDDDLVEVAPELAFVIGRVSEANIRIDGMIGGRRTYDVFWRAPSWMFHVNNEWAIAVVDGERLSPFAFETRPLRDGTVIEIRNCQTDEPIHRLRVEIG